ncbi:caspase domain-containing protein [Rutstroemia sp. NJR-2017a BBW]|nr:caspase domain-containing protein [Rutstroemia sp. NJR-2017a BBW]
MVKQYLEAGPTPVDVTILTATTPSNPSSRRPVEDPDLWPTYKNVIASLRRVLEKAKQGDFVYIHYSGHGTRSHQSGNLAFVLFEDNEHGSSYLRGPELAKCLRKMVAQGLFVTVVLDCCYSGSVMRGDNLQGVSVRAVDYDPTIDDVSRQESYPGPFDSDSTLRNAQVPLEQWLVDPDRYTILSASGPHEKAWELEIEGGQRRGALTYFLLEALSALRKNGVKVTHQSLYQHLRIRFHASWPQQTPMRYGNSNFSFFGKLAIVSNTALIPVYRTDDDRLCLSAGQAHGVHKGDDYVVYPFEAAEMVTNPANEASVKVRVDTVRCLTSDLVGIEATSPTKQIKTGWKAKPVTCISPRKIPVRLMESARCQSQWEEATQQQRFLHLCTENDTEPCIFNITLSEHNEYEILDGLHKRIVGLPTLPVDTPGAAGDIMDILQHLTTYKYFEAVENQTPSPSFKGSYSLLPLSGTGTSGTFDVKHGGTWGFTAENFSDQPLYLAIFNFTPSWQVSNLVSHSGGGDFLVVQPKSKDNDGKEEIRLQMEVPVFLQSRGRNYCEDIVKVFITSRPTFFPSMVLPEISLHTNDPCKRVRSNGGDQLSKFILELTMRFRSQDYVAHEEWASENFIIRTAME